MNDKNDINLISIMSAVQIKPAPSSHINIDPKLATHDSEESAQISNAPAVSASDRAAKLAATNLVDGHRDPRQRKIYLGLLSFTILNALVGLTLILVWMLHYRPVTGFGVSDKGQLSNLHVLLMFTFMVSLNMYAVLVYRTHFSRPKQQLKWIHALMTGSNMLMSLLGVASMYKAHLMGNLANFYSLHSWIGAMTNGFYVAQFAFGFVAFLRPQLSIQLRKQAMPWHRLVGTGIIILAGTAAVTGIAELVIFQDREGAYQNFTPITFIANFAGISVILMTASTVYLVTASHYQRVPPPEEMPVKN